MTQAKFTYYGSDESKNREVRFYRNPQGLYVCEAEGYPALKVTHPSKVRVKTAFQNWWEMAQKDWGASEIEWGDMS